MIGGTLQGVFTSKEINVCYPASFIVAGHNKRAFWSKSRDSHTFIRREKELPDNKPGRIFNVAVEVTPPGFDFNLPFESWEFKVDQDLLPEWWDWHEARETVLRELGDWAKHRFINTEVGRLREYRDVIVVKGGLVRELDTPPLLDQDYMITVSGGFVEEVLYGCKIYSVCAGGVIDQLVGKSPYYGGGGARSVRFVQNGGRVNRVSHRATIMSVSDGGSVGEASHGGCIDQVHLGGLVEHVFDGGRINKVFDGGVVNVLGKDGRIELLSGEVKEIHPEAHIYTRKLVA